METVLFFIFCGIIFFVFRNLFFVSRPVISKRERERRRKELSYINQQFEEIEKDKQELDLLKNEYADKRKIQYQNQNNNKYSQIYYIDFDHVKMTTSETEILEPTYIKSIKINEHPVYKFIIDLGFKNAKIQPPDYDIHDKYRCGILPFQINLKRKQYEKENKMKFRINNN